MNIQKRITKKNFQGGNGRKIEFIVIHYVGAVSTAENNARFFETQYRGASAHYFVDDTSVWQVVEDGDISWHCGDAGIGTHKNLCSNNNSIGIEMCCKMINGKLDIPDKTEANTVELVRELMRKYSIPVACVIRHYDVTKKICPAPMVHDAAKWNGFQLKIKN